MKIRRRRNKELKIDKFQQQLNVPTDEENRRELEETSEKEYLAKVREKNKKTLISINFLERERIARHIKDLYLQEKPRHRELCDDIDEYDRTYRMERRQATGVDSDVPNYVTPISTVVVEVIHANYMNVFFTPKDTMRIIPTETGDITNIKMLDIFGNWSVKNELEIFEKWDRLFHSSGKNGECPYMVHWVKEYGTEIKTEMLMNPANPSEPLLDPDTNEPLYQEREVEKILYNGPKLELFSRKDYILPKNAMSDKTPEWEMRRVRLSADKVKRSELEGKYYDDVFEEIGGWGVSENDIENASLDKESKEVPLGKSEKMFIEFYGRMRVDAIKTDKQGDEEYEELEDEFIGIVELKSETLCSLRKNKFPLKMRPIGLDVFIPDDEGRLSGIGVMEFMDGIQKSHDALHNQYLFGTIQANSPFGFFTPTGNMKDEPIKAKSGYLYPTSDPNSVNIVKIPAPDQSLMTMMEIVRNQSQVLFGISDYAAGIESSIDPTAPARKAELVVQQGNTRLNLIIKRKNKTLKDIFKRWYLLYSVNMPPNKFMRIAGEDKANQWKFESVNLTDFSLNSIPDFELTGNILNSNKTLEVNKALATYRTLITNPFFSPQTRQGLQSLHALTKWFLDKLDETGISNFLPSVKGEMVQTPEEENARFMQGDKGTPLENEDHVYHIKVHTALILDPSVPDEVRKNAVEHIHLHMDLLKKQVSQQMIMSQANQVRQMMPQGGISGQANPQGTVGQASGVVQPEGMAGLPTGGQANVQQL